MINQVKMALLLLCFISTGAMASGFWSTHHLAFIFSSQCPHCKNMAPTISQWSRQAGAPLKAYTVDGKRLPTLTNVSRASMTLINAAFPTDNIIYPALFIVENLSLRLYPVNFGELNHYQITERMALLQPKILSYEKRNSQ